MAMGRRRSRSRNRNRRETGGIESAAGSRVIQFFLAASAPAIAIAPASSHQQSNKEAFILRPALYALFFVAHKTQYPDLMSFVMHPLSAASLLTNERTEGRRTQRNNWRTDGVKKQLPVNLPAAEAAPVDMPTGDGETARRTYRSRTRNRSWNRRWKRNRSEDWGLGKAVALTSNLMTLAKS